MKKIVIFLLILVGCLSLGLAGYWYKNIYQIKTIAYDIKDAVQNKNLEKFNQLVDIKSISEDFVKGYRISQLNLSPNKSNEEITEKIIDSLKLSLVDTLYKSFSDDIETLIIQYLSNQDGYASLVFDNEEIFNFMENINWESIKINHNFSLLKNSQNVWVTLIVYNKLIDHDFFINFNLTKVGWWDWKVTGIKTFSHSLDDYYQSKKEILNKINLETKNEINKTAQITSYESKTFSYFPTFGNSTKHMIKVKNNSNRIINSIKIRIWLTSSEGELVEKIVEDRRGISPNDTITINVTDFDPNFNYEMSSNGIFPKMEISQIELGRLTLKYINDFEFSK